MDEAFLASCRTYTKVMNEIAREYGTCPPDTRYGERIECVLELVAQVVGEAAREAAHEVIPKLLQLAAVHMPGAASDALYISRGSALWIGASNIGCVQVNVPPLFRPNTSS